MVRSPESCDAQIAQERALLAVVPVCTSAAPMSAQILPPPPPWRAPLNLASLAVVLAQLDAGDGLHHCCVFSRCVVLKRAMLAWHAQRGYRLGRELVGSVPALVATRWPPSDLSALGRPHRLVCLSKAHPVSHTHLPPLLPCLLACPYINSAAPLVFSFTLEQSRPSSASKAARHTSLNKERSYQPQPERRTPHPTSPSLRSVPGSITHFPPSRPLPLCFSDREGTSVTRSRLPGSLPSFDPLQESRYQTFLSKSRALDSPVTPGRVTPHPARPFFWTLQYHCSKVSDYCTPPPAFSRVGATARCAL